MVHGPPHKTWMGNEEIFGTLYLSSEQISLSIVWSLSLCLWRRCVCRQELKFTATPSSMLAAASVLNAANGVLGIATAQHLQLIDRLHRITAIETVRIFSQLMCINPLND